MSRDTFAIFAFVALVAGSAFSLGFATHFAFAASVERPLPQPNLCLRGRQ